MVDTVMRRVWASPWTQVVLAVYFSWAASTQRGFWGWACFAAAVVSIWRFIDMGRKRWGSG